MLAFIRLQLFLLLTLFGQIQKYQMNKASNANRAGHAGWIVRVGCLFSFLFFFLVFGEVRWDEMRSGVVGWLLCRLGGLFTCSLLRQQRGRGENNIYLTSSILPTCMHLSMVDRSHHNGAWLDSTRTYGDFIWAVKIYMSPCSYNAKLATLLISF